MIRPRSSFAAPEFSGAEVKDEHGMDILESEKVGRGVHVMQWVFRCDVRRLALSIIPDDDDEMSPALCPSLSRLNLICLLLPLLFFLH